MNRTDGQKGSKGNAWTWMLSSRVQECAQGEKLAKACPLLHLSQKATSPVLLGYTQVV